MARNIYKNPVFLNSVARKSVRIAPVGSYLFGRELNSVLIVAWEFLEAAKFFPVVFAKGEKNEIVPMAILGLRNDQNLFIGADGKWREGAYIPAYFRRYPFIPASNVGQDGSYAVCVDAAYEGFVPSKLPRTTARANGKSFQGGEDSNKKKPAFPTIAGLVPQIRNLLRF